MKQTTAILTLLLYTGLLMAQPSADSLKNMLRRETDNIRKADMAFQLCEMYRQGNPDSCLFYANQAIGWLKGSGDEARLIKANLYIGSYYNIVGRPDTAFAIAEKNIRILEKKPEFIALLGQYYSFAGLCLMKMDQKRKAIEHFFLALRAGEKIDDYIIQLKALVNMGWGMMELNQCEDAIVNFQKAIALIDEKKLPRVYTPTIYNNMAACYGTLNKTDSAYKYALVAIARAKELEDPSAQANGLFILGTTQQTMGKLDEALQSFLEAQPLRELAGDPYFIVSDKAELASLYSKMGKSKEGITTGLEALEIANANNITAKLPMIYAALAESYEQAGDFAKAADAYKKISDLKDSMYADASPKALAEMRALYENEKLALESAERKIKIARQNFYILGIVAAALLAATVAWSYFRRYRLRKEAQLKSEILRQQEIATRAVIEAEEQERQRIARDLHDGVGQMMSAAKMNLSAFESEVKFENGEQRQDFSKILQLVDDSCREVRQVSHNMMPNVLSRKNLGAAVQDFIDKLDQKKLEIHLYTEGLEQRLDSNIETVFYRVIQECVNNVIKHAGATSLDISIVRDHDSLSATIEDNGRGFNTADKEKFEGMGLKNILSRIGYLKGTVEFDSAPGRGTAVILHVPVAATEAQEKSH